LLDEKNLSKEKMVHEMAFFIFFYISKKIENKSIAKAF